MNHYILRILALTLTMLALPALAKANPITLPSDEAPQIEATTSTINEASNFILSIQKGGIQVHATACQGQTLKVYDIVGKLKCEVAIDSNDKTIRVNLSKGIYLINIGQITRRVNIAS